jgi:hypothetical protein
MTAVTAYIQRLGSAKMLDVERHEPDRQNDHRDAANTQGRRKVVNGKHEAGHGPWDLATV